MIFTIAFVGKGYGHSEALKLQTMFVVTAILLPRALQESKIRKLPVSKSRNSYSYFDPVIPNKCHVCNEFRFHTMHV